LTFNLVLMRTRLVLVLGITVTLTLRPSTAHAQLEKFVQAVAELAQATRQSEPSRSKDVRIAAARMETALVEWDRNIRALEVRAERERAGAPDLVVYQLHVELGVASRVDALREFDTAAALRPSSDLQVLRALTFEAAARSQEAGQAFRTAWNLDPTSPVKAYYVAQRPGAGSASERAPARAFLAESYRRVGADAALPGAPFVTLGAIPDNLSPTPVIADIASSEGFALLGESKYGDAAAALRQIGQVGGRKVEDSPLTHFARGQRDEAQNRVPEARRAYQAALAGTLVGRSVLLVAIGRLAQVEGDMAGAIDAFNQAVQLNPNDPNIHKELAGAYAADGRPDEAFCELMAALLIDGRDAQVHADIGQLYLDGGHDEDAVTAFNRALELMPDRYETRYALATAFTRLGKKAEAAREFELFERIRREKLDERRRDIAREVEQEERPEDALRKRVPEQGGKR
jgi:tetratricopeptide (TPR) repeat protein